MCREVFLLQVVTPSMEAAARAPSSPKPADTAPRLPDSTSTRAAQEVGILAWAAGFDANVGSRRKTSRVALTLMAVTVTTLSQLDELLVAVVVLSSLRSSSSSSSSSLRSSSSSSSSSSTPHSFSKSVRVVCFSLCSCHLCL
jgi:hypothetical protein